MDAAQIKNNFNSHNLDAEQARKCDLIRSSLGSEAKVINGLCPDSREKSTALTKLEEAMFWANAAIARNPAS
jgi:hypothetical protein